ncbi:MAG: histone deacetylase [Gammaproteobacteria bacterium]|nr:histone deacetylase [Gammaproteobacteria bacterium]MDH5651151.1 histone deacetylase [Gammaproteobacteria bacterium]
MNIFYHSSYNINLGIFSMLHPFDGRKFAHVYKSIKKLPGIHIQSPDGQVKKEAVRTYTGEEHFARLNNKQFILGALEVPNIPLLPFWLIDNRILRPMRWGVAGTVSALRSALEGNHCWNMSGGYHHASANASEGFCIYNDIGIALQTVRQQGLVNPGDRFLIIDIDAHHGNGNALAFMNNRDMTLLDIYNHSIYPSTQYTKDRVDVNIPLRMGTAGAEYLDKLQNGLQKLQGGYRAAFIVAGTDVLESDPLGGLRLTLPDCLERDRLVLDRLTELSIPSVFLGGGGYSKQSATAITQSLTAFYQR